uniref:Uncharacterized protein n=1 Tax=Knipowitschia caucasica TaxID=637954 RepID=A0AAV2MK06_KNICA
MSTPGCGGFGAMHLHVCLLHRWHRERRPSDGESCLGLQRLFCPSCALFMGICRGYLSHRAMDEQQVNSEAGGMWPFPSAVTVCVFVHANAVYVGNAKSVDFCVFVPMSVPCLSMFNK